RMSCFPMAKIIALAPRDQLVSDPLRLPRVLTFQSWQADCFCAVRQIEAKATKAVSGKSKGEMKLKSTLSRQPISGTFAYAMIEVIMGVALTGFMFVSLYGGISSSFAVTQLARENLRGTQIMLERMEGIRLYNWDQLCYSNMIPATFTNY